MSQLNKKKIYPLVIIILTSIIFLLISIESNKLQKLISGSSNLFNIVSGINNIVAFAIPILAFAFFLVTTKFMFLILDIEVSTSKTNVQTVIAESFLPLLIFSAYYLINITIFNYNNISEVTNFENIKFLFGLDFYDLKIVSYFAWILIYVILIIELKEQFKINYYKSFLTATIPSLILFLLKFILNEI